MRALSNGDPGGTRTPYLQIRNLSLYPDELRDHTPLMPEIIPKCQAPFKYHLLTNDALGRINRPHMWRAKGEATIATS